MLIQFDDTLGAVSIGFSISCVVFGILTMQVFTYFRNYPSDRPVYKLLVATLWLLELFDQVLIGTSVYFYTVTHLGDVIFLVTGDVIWTLIVQIIVNVTVGTIVKVCFAMRVWRFSGHNRYIVGLILSLTTAQFGLGTAYMCRAFKFNKFVHLDKLKTLATLSLGSGVVTDFLTASALCYFLRQLRTGYKKSDTLVNSLTRYAVNTGALTSAISLTTLILYNIEANKFYFIASYFLLGKLYAISFLCTLNTRKIIRGKGTDRPGGTGGTSNTANLYSNTFLMVSHAKRPHTNDVAHTKSVEIGVHQEVSVVSDVESNTRPIAPYSYI